MEEIIHKDKTMSEDETERIHYNMEETEEKIYACWAATLWGIGRKRIHELVRYAGSYKGAYELPQKQIQILLGDESNIWQQHKKELSPQAYAEHIENRGIHFTFYGASDFPKKLADIPDAPLGLFYLGSLPNPVKPAIAMIGARRYSDYGRCMAEHFAEQLAKAGIAIVSGMAMGIDGISQRTALKAGGISYGILGCGVDIPYPPSNERLYWELIEKGSVISEAAPGVEPRPFLFPQRNRIISALADVVLVVEAREKSGTFITVDTALEQGREVYAIPGRCTDGLSMGCNKLLRQGAGIAVTPEELLEDLGWKQKGVEAKSDKLCYDISEAASKIYSVLDVMPLTQDEIIAELRKKNKSYTIPEICRGLLELEMKQIVLRTGGQYRLTIPKI